MAFRAEEVGPEGEDHAGRAEQQGEEGEVAADSAVRGPLVGQGRAGR